MSSSGLAQRPNHASEVPEQAQAPAFSVLEIGAGWYPEFCAGLENGYYNLTKNLPGTNVTVRGLVLGSSDVQASSGGMIRAFSPRSGPLARRLWLARKAISDVVSSDRPDIVASHFALFTLAGLDRIGKIPLVVHFHGPWAEEAAIDGAGRVSVAVKTEIERAVYKRANRFIVLSRAFGETLCSRYGVDSRKIQIIPGGVDCSRFLATGSRADARRRLGWQTDGPIVLSVRRLARRMGLQELILGMTKVKQIVPNVRLLIAGKGPEEANLRKMIDDLGLSGTVRLVGFVPDELLPSAYRAADFSIVPSSALEGFGLSTAESLASGTPVIVTPVGGLPETVEDLEPRLVLGAFDSDSLAKGVSDALCGIIPLPSGDKCRSYAQSRFDWKVIAEQTRDVYARQIG